MKKTGYFLARTSGCVLKVWVLNFVKLAAAVFSGRTTKDKISDIEAARIAMTYFILSSQYFPAFGKN